MCKVTPVFKWDMLVAWFQAIDDYIIYFVGRLYIQMLISYYKSDIGDLDIPLGIAILNTLLGLLFAIIVAIFGSFVLIYDICYYLWRPFIRIMVSVFFFNYLYYLFFSYLHYYYYCYRSRIIFMIIDKFRLLGLIFRRVYYIPSLLTLESFYSLFFNLYRLVCRFFGILSLKYKSHGAVVIDSSILFLNIFFIFSFYIFDNYLFVLIRKFIIFFKPFFFIFLVKFKLLWNLYYSGYYIYYYRAYFLEVVNYIFDFTIIRLFGICILGIWQLDFIDFISFLYYSYLNFIFFITSLIRYFIYFEFFIYVTLILAIFFKTMVYILIWYSYHAIYVPVVLKVFDVYGINTFDYMFLYSWLLLYLSYFLTRLRLNIIGRLYYNFITYTDDFRLKWRLKLGGFFMLLCWGQFETLFLYCRPGYILACYNQIINYHLLFDYFALIPLFGYVLTFVVFVVLFSSYSWLFYRIYTILYAWVLFLIDKYR